MALFDQWRTDLIGILPELILSGGVILLIIIGLFTSKIHRICSIGLLALSSFLLLRIGFNNDNQFFNGLISTNALSVYLRILVDITGILTCLMRYNKHRQSEYFVMIIAAVSGCHFLLITSNLLMIFLAIEIISISSYILVGFSFTRASAEGSVKFFLFGATASACMLYGLSILYGISGEMTFDKLLAEVTSEQSGLVITATFLIMAGLFFKISATPMHVWVPDVFESAVPPVMAFLSVAPKLAAFGVLTHLYWSVLPSSNQLIDWQTVLCWVGMITIAVGNFSALRQTGFKRLMAYSSIAHSGFLLIGIICSTTFGLEAFIFYVTVYTFSSFLVFIYLDYFQTFGIEKITAFAGLGKIYLVPSIALLIGLVSLTGLPPTAGFTSKLLIFSALWDAYLATDKTALLILFIFGLINTVISLFFYLQVPYQAFLKTSESTGNQNNWLFTNFFGLFLVVVILVLFFLPGLLMGWINKINFVL